VSTPTPEEAFLEYARGTGWDETAVRVVLDTVRKARHAAALETRERCARAVCEGCREGWPYRAETECHGRPDGVAVACDAVPVRASDVP
jgi:hypothetical protein